MITNALRDNVEYIPGFTAYDSIKMLYDALLVGIYY